MQSQTFKREYKITRAFRALFLDEKGNLTDNGKIVLSYLRDVCGARGELGDSSSPYLYDSNNRFDSGAAAFLLGRRRVFDLIVRHLAINELDIFSLISEQDKEETSEDRIANILGY